MEKLYLLHFVHEHIPFRWPEFLAVTSRNGCEFVLISKQEQLSERPFILIKLLNSSSSHHESLLIKSAQECFLIKDLYELWAQSDESLEELSQKAALSAPNLSNQYSGPNQPFRINCITFGVTTPQAVKIEMMKKMSFMQDYQSAPDLKNPSQIYCLLEMNTKLNDGTLKKEFYFGRHLATGDRKRVNKFSLKHRVFIGNTSMDPLLSFLSANAAKVKPGDIVYDPFVGSGSLLIAAACLGGRVLGADINWLMLHGKSRPSRVGTRQREQGECIRANMRQYELESNYLDVIVSDISRLPFNDNFRLDAIITDPPYGVRECSEKIGRRENQRERRLDDHRLRYPSKANYTIEDLLKDLLQLAAKHLNISSRLIYYLPVTKHESEAAPRGNDDDDDYATFDHYIPSHPSLRLVSYSEQQLTRRNYRLMVVMEKVAEPSIGSVATIPEIVFKQNFRATYFNQDLKREGPSARPTNVSAEF